MAKTTDKKDEATKSKEFLSQNWWLLFVSQGLLFFYMWSSLSSIKDKYNEVLQVFKDSSRGVVMLDYSGRAIYTEKTQLDILNPGFKKAIANAIRFYGIKDWNSISKGYKNKVKTVEELEKSDDMLVEFKENFFNSEDQQGIADFDAFEKTLLYLLNADLLPEKIQPTNATITSYKVDGDKFEIEVLVDVTQNVYLLETDKWVDKTGQIVVKAGGYFNPSKATEINPLGIKFESFKPTYLKKR